MNNKCTNSKLKQVFCLVILTFCFVSHARGQTADAPRILSPNQNLEREMTGAETHRYKFDLAGGEFFQVRVEQKGVDVGLKLLDETGGVLAAMDSPNGREGFETLSFAAEKAGKFVLEVTGFDKKVGKSFYAIKREAGRKANAADERRIAVERLFGEAIRVRDAGGQNESAIAKFEAAAAGWEELKDVYLSDLTRRQITALKANKINAEIFGAVSEDLRKAQTTLSEGQLLTVKSAADSLAARMKFNESLTMFRGLSERLKNETLAARINQSGEFAPQLLGTLILFKLISKSGEALALSGISQTHFFSREWRESIDFLKSALAVYEEMLGDKSFQSEKSFLLQVRELEVAALGDVAGKIEVYLGDRAESVKYFSLAVEKYQSLFRDTQNSKYQIEEAQILTSLAMVYRRESKNFEKSIELYRKAIEIYCRHTDKKFLIATNLDLIATAQSANFDYQSALENWTQALAIYREADYKMGQSSVLQSLATMYWVTNNKPKLIETVNQLLAVTRSADFVEKSNFPAQTDKELGLRDSGAFKEMGVANAEALRLNLIAFAYRLLEDYPKSLEYYEKSLTAARARKQPRDIGSNLYWTAFTLAKMQRWKEALDYYREALEISRNSGATEEIAGALQDVGWVLLESGNLTEALAHQNNSLIKFQSIGVDETRAFSPAFSALLNEMSRTHYALGNRRLAIFYGKRAVNAMQGERRRLQNLGAAAQKGFLEHKEKHYRRLADWLIGEGRLPEAQQVLDLIKEEEFFEFVRRDSNEAAAEAKLALNEIERKSLDEYAKLADELTALGARFQVLQDKRAKAGNKLAEAEEIEYQALKKQIENAGEGLQILLGKFAAEFSKKVEDGAVITPQSIKTLQTDLRRAGNDVVLVSTYLLPERYRAIVTTGRTMVDRKVEYKDLKLTGAEVNKKIARFQQALQNPAVDPRPLGKELYDIFVRPLEKDLRGAKAKTVLWSLDGSLRYIPIAALSPDGATYLAEHYENVVVTLARQTNLFSKPSGEQWRAIGAGVSKEHAGFSALPSVTREIEIIVRNETDAPQTGTGVLAGRRMLDADFDLDSFRDTLTEQTEDGKPFNVVHLATHFKLGATNQDSALLLGDGTQLSLYEIGKDTGIDFKDVELLTLSACETGVSIGAGTGGEVESLGMLAQQKGAKAVLATLWKVADDSTQILMAEFYRLRQENPAMSKSEAIRRAQIAMIEGKLKSAGEAKTQRSKFGGVTSGEGKEFVTNPNKPFAHPYFWSPFVLIGNWR